MTALGRVATRRGALLMQLGVAVWVTAWVRPALAVDYPQARQIAAAFIALHSHWKKLDDVLSQRTFDRLLNALDPGKLYFLKAEVDQLKSEYGDRIDDLVQSGDWSFLETILEAQKQKYLQRLPLIDSLIDQDQDFAEEDFLIQANDREFLETADQFDERWREEIKFHKLQLRRVYTDEAEVRKRLHARFERNRRTLEEWTLADRCTIFLRSFASSLDPHSDYLTPLAHENLQIALKLHLVGIGTVIGQNYGITTIRSLVPGGPAEKSGLLQAGDVILAVGQGTDQPVEITDEPLDRVVQLIRGPAGTDVRLTIQREKDGIRTRGEVVVARGDVKVESQAAKGRTFEVVVQQEGGQPRTLKVGWIRLTNFYGRTGQTKSDEASESTSVDVKRLIGELSAAGMDALVLDLRSNGGGLMDEAIKTAGLFFDSGPVLQVRQKTEIKVHADPDHETAHAGPLLVLVNRISASASEIVAAAIQDYGRGVIVGGTHTFGKGTVQNVMPLNPARIPEGGAIKTTVSQFYRVSGGTTQFEGVKSDIELPSALEAMKVGERFLNYPLEPTQVDPTDFTRLDRVGPYLDQLRAASQRRVQESPVFQKVLTDVAEYRKREDQRTRVSLKVSNEPEPDEAAVTADENPAVDVHLRECLAIAADYVQLETGRALGAIAVPELDTPPAAAEKEQG